MEKRYRIKPHSNSAFIILVKKHPIWKWITKIKHINSQRLAINQKRSRKWMNIKSRSDTQTEWTERKNKCCLSILGQVCFNAMPCTYERLLTFSNMCFFLFFCRYIRWSWATSKSRTRIANETVMQIRRGFIYLYMYMFWLILIGCGDTNMIENVIVSIDALDNQY